MVRDSRRALPRKVRGVVMDAGYYFWAWAIGLSFLALCVWIAYAVDHGPVQEGEYSRLDRLDGLGDRELISERVAAGGGSAETATFTTRYHEGAA